jgi:hypothetical protein
MNTAVPKEKKKREKPPLSCLSISFEFVLVPGIQTYLCEAWLLHIYTEYFYHYHH